MSEGNNYNGNQSGLSLTEIQKLEEEREREAKMRREMQEAAQARARAEEEARRPQVNFLFSFKSERNWYLNFAEYRPELGKHRE